MRKRVRLLLASALLALLMAAPAGTGFAQPDGEKSNNGFLGVRLEDGENGARIVEVIPDSAAARAGLRVGDTIVAAAAKAIPDAAALVGVVGRHQAGGDLALGVKRGAELLRITVTLGRRPALKERLSSEELMPPTKPKLPKIPDSLPTPKPPPEK